MKKSLILPLFLFLASLIQAQYVPDTIYAVVDGNNVTLADEGALRVCNETYAMQVIKEDNTIRWNQNIDHAGSVYCLCNFDYSVEVGPLDEGSYAAEVYYELWDENYQYIGSCDFLIALPGSGPFQLINSTASDCYNIITDVKEVKNPVLVHVYPNPVETILTFELNLKSCSKLSIVNILGTEVFNIDLKDRFTRIVKWNLKDASGQRVSTGLYFYVLESTEHNITGKLMVK